MLVKKISINHLKSVFQSLHYYYTLKLSIENYKNNLKKMNGMRSELYVSKDVVGGQKWFTDRSIIVIVGKSGN